MGGRGWSGRAGLAGYPAGRSPAGRTSRHVGPGGPRCAGTASGSSPCLRDGQGRPGAAVAGLEHEPGRIPEWTPVYSKKTM